MRWRSPQDEGAAMKQILPVVFALIPLVAVIGAWVVVP